MADQPSAPTSKVDGWLGRLSVPVLAGVGLLILVGVGAGGYYAYETYDYVQHDNDFCMSCHLMQQPYELFAESAHRGLGCKACHQPNLVQRSSMALAQIIENPEDISVHAEVPNERCADCHIEGDPEKWRLIANSAGHKAHFESDDPMLEGLQCVECHSTSVHEFAPIDRTCAQSGCHEDNTIQLGEMSDLTIHCAACHTFVAPVVAGDEGEEILGSGVDAAILPDQEECLSCHVMRTLVEMPDPDPHDGVCAACHNPHEQERSAEAVQSCANAGCHAAADTLTPFHRGMGPGVLEDCLYCHEAHDFEVNGENCLDCHQGIVDDSLAVPRAGGGSASRMTPDTSMVMGLSASPYAHQPLGVGVGVGVGWWSHALPAAQESPRFLHSDHRNVECGNCHVSRDGHGELAVTTLSDCRSCHHTEPVSRDCARCHGSEDVPDQTFRPVRSFELSVGGGSRTLTFRHEPHAELDCAQCHTEGTNLSAADAECASCHEEHHAAGNDCASCHVRAPVSAHPPSEGHVTCSGAGCHQAVPFEGLPRTRSVCLVCHQDLRDHRPGRACIECHTLPDPRGAAQREQP